MNRQSSQLEARAHPTVPDAELLRRVASGEIDALGQLYDRHHEALGRFLARATTGADDVDDLLHSTFLTAAQAAKSYDGRAACRPWLIGIAVQLLRRRRHAVARLFATLASLRLLGSAQTDPRATFEARGDVERALRRLSEPKRVTLLLAEVEGLSCQEIAEMLAVPIGTVWTRLHAARRELRRALGEETP